MCLCIIQRAVEVQSVQSNQQKLLVPRGGTTYYYLVLLVVARSEIRHCTLAVSRQHIQRTCRDAQSSRAAHLRCLPSDEVCTPWDHAIDHIALLECVTL